MIHGVDVSDYQSATYSTSGLDFVFVKATEGLSYTNALLTAQTKRGRGAGLVVGFYHYPHMANDPVAEADFFLSKAPIKVGDVIVFDWEGYDTANKAVPKTRQIAYRDAWLKYVKGKLPAHRVGMYCNTDYWLNVDKTGTFGDFLWIATGGLPAGQPGIKAKWTFHQYSTAGGIDHDVASFDSRAALAAWAAGTTPQEDDVALTTDDINKVAAAVVAKLLTGDGLTREVWVTDGVIKNPNPDTAPTNPFIAPATGLTNIETVVRRTEKAIAALPAVQLTDQQIAGLASAVAANPSLAGQIAEQVAEKLAARLAD